MSVLELSPAKLSQSADDGAMFLPNTFLKQCGTTVFFSCCGQRHEQCLPQVSSEKENAGRNKRLVREAFDKLAVQHVRQFFGHGPSQTVKQTKNFFFPMLFFLCFLIHMSLLLPQ